MTGKNNEPQITITGIQNNNDSSTNTRLKFESLKVNLLFDESENFSLQYANKKYLGCEEKK